MNMIRSSMNNSIILVTTHNQIIISENMTKNWIKQVYTYCAFAFGKMNGDDRTKTVLQTKCSRRCRR